MALPHTYMGKLREVHRKNLDIKQSRKPLIIIYTRKRRNWGKGRLHNGLQRKQPGQKG